MGNQLINQLKKDKELRQVYKANIAMAFDDCYHQYVAQNKISKPSAKDIRIIANSASEYFIRLLIDDTKQDDSGADGMVALAVNMSKIIKEEEKEFN